MNWDDTGFLISKNRYNENSLISEIYTKNHGKVSGVIFGGTSKKIKNQGGVIVIAIEKLAAVLISGELCGMDQI